jgi:hypothetical protein
LFSPCRYYGGCCGTNAAHKTAVGVAASTDGGRTFHRLNGGKPIIESAGQPSVSTYGAGQPSVVFKHPYFYMVWFEIHSRCSCRQHTLTLVVAVVGTRCTPTPPRVREAATACS